MKIEKLGIEKIRPYENNAKLHPKEQIEQIKKSIEEFGNNDPIAIDENNVIIEGHGRYFALKELGYKEAEIIRLSHLSDEQRKAYTLVHNKLTMNTGFDFEKLNFELGEIKNIDMSKFDFEIKIDLDEEKEPKNNAKEITGEEFGDEEFDCECPRCGFKFNA
jgi:ParB-like chromosome segregation protein Spo0J